jgi:hypothetical protein
MATRRYGISQGEEFKTYVTEAVGAATAADDVELTVDLANIDKREEAVHAVKRILAYLEAPTTNWPPA